MPHLNPVSKTVSKTPHIAFVDGIRACAALYVVIHHALMYIPVPASTALKLFAQLFSNGHAAVNVFIILSGFCLMQPVLANQLYLKGGVQQFYKRRAWRILPPYYLTIIICILLSSSILAGKTGTQWDGTLGFNRWDIISRCFLLQDIFYDTHAKINYSLWSVAVECQIYLLFPLLLISWRRFGGGITLAASLVVSLALWLSIVDNRLFNITRSGINPHYLVLFAMGAGTAYVHQQIGSQKGFFSTRPLVKSIVASLLLLAVLTLVKHVLNSQSNIPQFAFNDLREGVLSAFILLLLCSNKIPWLHKMLSSGSLAGIGTFSYTIYLLHPPLLQIFTQSILQPLSLPTGVQVFLMLFIGIPFVTGSAYVLYQFIEKPFSRPMPAFNKKALENAVRLRWFNLLYFVRECRSVSVYFVRILFFHLKKWP